MNAATVAFTDVNIALYGITSKTFAVNGGGTLIWNIGSLYSVTGTYGYDLGTVNNTYGINFTSATKGDGNIVLGAGAAMHNYTFSNVNVSFADGLGSSVNFTGSKALTYSDTTFAAGANTSVINVSSTSTTTFSGLYLNGITMNFNSALTGGISFGGTSGGSVVVNANSTVSSVGYSSGEATLKVSDGVVMGVTGRITMSSNNIILGEGASLSSNAYNISTADGNNVFKKLTMASGSVFTVAGGMRIGGTGSVVNGTINVNGSGRNSDLKNSDDFIFGITGGVTFGASAILNQAYQSVGATNWITGSMVVNSDTGSLRFGNVMNFGRTSTTTLNTTDAIISGGGDLGATSQATSTFRLASYATTGNGAKFVVNAANNVGSFELAQDGNKLYLEFGEGGSLTVGEDAGLTSFSGDYLGTDMIVLVGDILNKLKVYDLSEEQIQDYFTSSTGSTIYTVAADDGAYWVNTVVPEPAEWAAIFGAVALGLALYRRKRI